MVVQIEFGHRHGNQEEFGKQEIYEKGDQSTHMSEIFNKNQVICMYNPIIQIGNVCKSV